MEKGRILLFVPNIIGYIRIALVAMAFIFYHQPFWFVILYTTSMLLDGLDGYAARKLNQCSDFGAWFDVVIDLLSRGLLWCSLYQYGYAVIFVEWLTFVCTHCRGPKWKIPEENFPWVVNRVMENGFKSPLGVYAIGALHFLPVWMYMCNTGFISDVLGLPFWAQIVGGAMLALGRALCMHVECFYIYNHVMNLLHSDSSRQAN